MPTRRPWPRRPHRKCRGRSTASCTPARTAPASATRGRAPKSYALPMFGSLRCLSLNGDGVVRGRPAHRIDAPVVQRQGYRAVGRPELVPHPVGPGGAAVTYRGDGSEVDVLVEDSGRLIRTLLQHSAFRVDEDAAPHPDRTRTVDAHGKHLVHNRIRP